VDDETNIIIIVNRYTRMDDACVYHRLSFLVGQYFCSTGFLLIPPDSQRYLTLRGETLWPLLRTSVCLTDDPVTIVQLFPSESLCMNYGEAHEAARFLVRYGFLRHFQSHMAGCTYYAELHHKWSCSQNGIPNGILGFRENVVLH